MREKRWNDKKRGEDKEETRGERKRQYIMKKVEGKEREKNWVGKKKKLDRKEREKERVNKGKKEEREKQINLK